MLKEKRDIIIVQLITLSRAIAALVFITIALTPKFVFAATVLFIYACVTDVVDGFLARKFSCTTNTGKILDLFGDKYLTVISLTYAIARGMPALPCAIAILREILLLSMRSIYMEGEPLFPPQRLLGTLMVIPIWSGTVLLLLSQDILPASTTFFAFYFWILGGLASINLTYKILVNWKKILQSFNS